MLKSDEEPALKLKDAWLSSMKQRSNYFSNTLQIGVMKMASSCSEPPFDVLAAPNRAEMNLHSSANRAQAPFQTR